jgi:hypothetical protein
MAVEFERIVEVESRWDEAKREAGLDGREVKYSMTWPDQKKRGELIRLIGELPVQAVIALLEDFRPKRIRLSRDKEKRGERYVHIRAFEWVLQRLAEPNYQQPDAAPHFVAFDLRDDFGKLADEYARHHPAGWRFSSRTLPSLRVSVTQARCMRPARAR